MPSATGPDVEPGDGACETGASVCSLQAAVEEANTLDTPPTSPSPTASWPATSRTSGSATPATPVEEMIDAIPVGTLRCGTGWDDDLSGMDVRPYDGDDDQTAARDIGAYEARSIG